MGGQSRTSTIFYMDDRILTYPRLARLQAALNVLTGLLNHVGQKKNVGNKVGMAWQPCRTSRSMLEGSYTRRIIRVGPSYWENNQERNQRPDCGTYLAAGSLYTHHQTQHRARRTVQWAEVPEDFQNYQVSLPSITGDISCLVPG